MAIEAAPDLESGSRPAASLVLRGLAVGPVGPLDLDVSAGEIVCLSGPSGAGKSRLLRAIADLDPHQGEVGLGDAGQQQMPGHRWRAQVMMLPAESQWWFDTVGEHFPAAPIDGLAALGLDAAAGGWEVARLSSGEKQRLALLRLLARRPQALLLDEPCANLDRKATGWVEALLRSRVRDARLPTLWVSHDPDQIARVADRHLCFDGGRLVVAR
ncbi:MAG: ATP-binding cassette domain-containing protein [Rhodocyclaceae bacterium]|nr:ATP-binding cassette domain-containing protein [Rhodocyclaceae bacterium]